MSQESISIADTFQASRRSSLLFSLLSLLSSLYIGGGTSRAIHPCLTKTFTHHNVRKQPRKSGGRERVETHKPRTPSPVDNPINSSSSNDKTLLIQNRTMWRTSQLHLVHRLSLVSAHKILSGSSKHRFDLPRRERLGHCIHAVPPPVFF
jgi:hypothetical protein